DRELVRREDGDDRSRLARPRAPLGREEGRERGARPRARELLLRRDAVDRGDGLLRVRPLVRRLGEEGEDERGELARHRAWERRWLSLDELAEPREHGLAREGRHP